MQPPTVASLEDPEFHRLNLRALAGVIAFGFFKASEAMRRFGLNQQQSYLLASNPRFKDMIAESRQQWASMTPAERVRLKAQVAMDEMLLDEMVLMALDDRKSIGERMDAAKAVMKVGGFENTRGSNERDSGPSMTPFSINIHLGGDRVTSITAAPTIESRPA